MQRECLHVRVVGVVQGVGFRPFVHRLATELGLPGSILNDAQGVTIEVEGERAMLLEFLRRLQDEKPPASVLFAIDHHFGPAKGADAFRILRSETEGPTRTWVLPDLAMCADCERELLDPRDRRFGHPFLNCTNCGPRFSILESLPYDRPRTAMKNFPMCDRCRAEYEDPEDRRFHAQPTACPDCGPTLRYEDLEGLDAIDAAAATIAGGGIVGVKGLGGYHIVVDATNEEAVQRLRARKGRPTKPLAVMYPDLETLESHVEVPDFARPLLRSMQAPIVLLPRKATSHAAIADAVAPDAPTLGVFLPYTPVHRLLLERLRRPVVATSGNFTDEPTIHDDTRALDELAGVCDGFLVHDRPILRQVDDSVAQVLTRPVPQVQILRRARGYAPLPLLSRESLPPILALGGHMNSTIAFSRDREVVLSPHLGSLETFETREALRRSVDDLLSMYRVRPELVVHDEHPDYFTTALAEELGRAWEVPTHAVQHHHAHLAAALLEHDVEGPALGICWDGTGHGRDGTIWGGEFLIGDARDFRRVATLVPLRLPGGEAAVAETWRTALSLLTACFGEDLPRDLPLFSRVGTQAIDATLQLLEKDVRCPVTTSVGRLFDGVAAILGLSLRNTHQAESPQRLEFAAWRSRRTDVELPCELVEDDLLRIDWRPMVREIVERWRSGEPVEDLAAGFHRGLAASAAAIASRHGDGDVLLTGGVFCNRFLGEDLLDRLAHAGLQGKAHAQLPPTDGSLSAGQLFVAAHRT